LVLAISIFASEQKKLPNDLEELIETKILGQLPLDPFSAEQFLYSREQKAIWSVGWDGHVSPSATPEDTDVDIHLWRLRFPKT